MNPGPWIGHTEYVAKAARILAPLIGLDADMAEAYALIHDIGRREGMTRNRHIVDGYNFMKNEGYEDAAAICMTHSFPGFKILGTAEENGLTQEHYTMIAKFLDEHPISEMEKLIMLCDSIALASGFITMERRLLDGAIRYGVNSHTREFWISFVKLQIAFEEKIGKSIYHYLPGIAENTLERPLKESWPHSWDEF